MGIQIGRREFILTPRGAAAAWPLASRAQQPAHIPHVGWIWPGAAAGNPTELAGFKQGLRELGYVGGRNIVVEYRFGGGTPARLGRGSRAAHCESQAGDGDTSPSHLAARGAWRTS